jgi:hypothetical protein
LSAIWHLNLTSLGSGHDEVACLASYRRTSYKWVLEPL